MTNEQTPPELRSIAQQLDDLGEHDRSAAPNSLEQRVFDRVRPSMTDTTNAPAPLPFPRAFNHWRLAAMLAVTAGATIIVTWSLWPSNQVPSSSDAEFAEIESEINDFLAITASWEVFDESPTDSASDLASDFWGPEEDDDLMSEDTL